jgi:prepilin-type N-terminal cleavage/methylation domain-containing protein
MNVRGRFAHPVTVARRATRRRVAGEDEAGFTLIELVIVVIILPIVLGGIATALLSVFGLQDQTQNRIGDSNDEQVSSSTFNKDVQSAQEIETATTPACGSSGQTQLVGLEWGLDASGNYQTVVSYVLVPNDKTYDLVRQICSAPPSPPSSTPTSSRVVSHDTGPPCTTAPCAAGTTTVALTPSTFPSPTAGWVSTQGLYGVTLNIVAPGSGYTYSLSGLPSAAPSTGTLSQIKATQNPAGCNLASPGSGNYAKVMCFADFSSFTNANSDNNYCPNGTGQEMQLSIADSPDILQFCVSDPTNNVNPYPIPTYYNPGASGYNSEAYLGNNGFYTGIADDPALYQKPTNGAYSVVNFTNIEVTNAVGVAATGWTLVTGDAESTDQHEWIAFTTNNSWSILPNTTASLYGNSCYDDLDAGDSGLFKWTGPTPPTTTTVGDPGPGAGTGPPATGYATTLATPTAPNYLTGASSILCESDQQLNKTGTLMLASPEPANSLPQSVTVSMKGAGYQALFFGVLL